MDQDNTPPSSPLMQSQADFNSQNNYLLNNSSQFENEILEEKDVPLCFNCCGELNPACSAIASESSCVYLKTGHLQRFIKGDVFTNASVDSFFFQEELESQFFLVRKKIAKLELLLNNTSTLTASEMLDERISLRQFINDLLSTLHSAGDTFWSPESEELQHLCDHVKALLLHVGRLSDLPAGAASKYGNSSTSVTHHFFHMCLEVHWGVIEILHYISMKMRYPSHLSTLQLCAPGRGESGVEGDFFSQTVQLLLWDYVQLALHKFQQINNIAKEAHFVSSFTCTCTRDTLVMLRHLLHYREEVMSRESLITLLQPVLQYLISSEQGEHSDTEHMEINSDVYPVPPVLPECRDNITFAWWLISNLMTTFLFDVRGRVSGAEKTKRMSLDKSVIQGFSDLMRQLVKKSIVLSEVHLRCHLLFNLRIAGYCQDPDTPLLAAYWDVFYKRLNDTYSLTSHTLGHLQSIQVSAGGLLEISRKIKLNDSQHILNATSFELFLHLLCLELQKGRGEWKALKGRIYSKFHSRRMGELSELGLQHFSLLFLCLMQVADVEDVVQKTMDLYSTLNISALNIKKRKAVWRGILAVILYHVENNIDVLHLADKMAASFNAVVSSLCTPGLVEPSKHQDLWDLIQLYIDSTQDIIDSSRTLNLHQHRLIASGFQNIMKICKENGLKKMLSFAEAVLTKHRISHHTAGTLHMQPNSVSTSAVAAQKQELGDTLWSYFFSFIKDYASTVQVSNSTSTPSLPQDQHHQSFVNQKMSHEATVKQVADLAAGFCLLAVTSGPSPLARVREDIVTCFSHFAWNENVKSRISVRFLCHILPNQEAMDKLCSKVSALETRLIQSWVKCSLEIPAHDEEMVELTRLMQKLSAVEELRSVGYSGSIGEWSIQEFINQLGSLYSNCQDLRSKTEAREKISKYFLEAPKVVSHLMKNCLSKSIMSIAYSICGHLVKTCAGALYLKSKPDCLLPILIDKMILPRHLLIHNKPIPNYLMPALQENLHLFIHGLSTLDYRRDPFIQRKLKDIVSIYLNKFPLSNNSHQLTTTVHPFISLFRDSIKPPVHNHGDESSFRSFFLGVIANDLKAGEGGSVSTQTALNYILEIFSRTAHTEEIARDCSVVLRTSLDHMLLSDNTEIRGQATRVMQYTMEATAKHSSSADLSVISSIIEKFFKTHVRSYGGTKVLKVLESIAVLNPRLLVPLIPVMTDGVKASEGKRGVGLDKQLRMAYYSVLSNLGEEGLREKTALIRTSSL